MSADEFSVRRFLGIGDLETAYLLPGLENPADGMTEVKSDMLPLLRQKESEAFHPGTLRPLEGLATNRPLGSLR